MGVTPPLLKCEFQPVQLLSTSDGGATWTLLPDPPIGDPPQFLSPERGWLAGGPAADELYTTTDGALTWRRVEVLVPNNIVGIKSVALDLGSFDDVLHGGLAATIRTRTGSVVVLYETDDGES